jgi:hypothetical protein
MNSQKFFLGGIVGGIVFFLLGWVFFGMLFKDIFPQPTNMIWWALILGNLVLGFLLAYILGKAGASSVGVGASIGFVIGLMLSVGVSLIEYATAVEPMSTKAMAAHVGSITVMWTIAGAIVGWVRGMGIKP